VHHTVGMVMSGGRLGMLARAAAARSRLGLVGVVVLVAVGGGAVIATLAAASRTGTAHDRMIAATHAYDVLVNPDNGSDSHLDTSAVGRLPEVADEGRGDGIALMDVRTGSMLPIPIVSDGHGFLEIGRPKVLSGRLPDPAKGDEVFVADDWAQQAGVRVGDVIPTVSASKAEIAAAPEELDFSPASLVQAAKDGRFGRITNLHVVGTGVWFDDVVRDDGEGGVSLVLTPAYPALDGTPLDQLSQYYGLEVRLRSPQDLPRLRADVEAMVPDESIAFRTLPSIRGQVTRTIRPLVISLAAVGFAGAALLVALISVVLLRVVSNHRTEQAQWWVLGAVRQERALGVGAGLAGAVVVGSVLAVAVAWLLSPLGPVGAARVAEPSPGLHFDRRLLLGSALVLLVVALAIVAVVAWRTTRISPRRTIRPSRLVDRAAGFGLPNTMVVGLRNTMAGPEAIVAALVAIAVGATVLTFTSGVQRFTTTPALYGWNWDSIISWSGPEDASEGEVTAWARGVAGSPRTDGAAVVSVTDVVLDGTPVVAAAFEPLKGHLGPTLAAGRLPRDDGEIALGGRTMRSLGVGVGDVVAAAGGQRLRVVGRIVLPSLANYSGSDKTAVGEGAVVTPSALRALGPSFSPVGLAVRTAPGSDVDQLTAEHPPPSPDIELQAVARQRPSDIIQLHALSEVPFLLAAVLAALALVVAVHAVWSAAQRRRREHAVLRALGWRPRDSRAGVLWHAVGIMLLAVLAGLPIGLVAGRWLWRRLASFLGTVPVSVAPLVTLLVAAAIFGLVAVGAAVIPAQRAARRPPAVALRVE
jgi:hypothetical protein